MNRRVAWPCRCLLAIIAVTFLSLTMSCGGGDACQQAAEVQIECILSVDCTSFTDASEKQACESAQSIAGAGLPVGSCRNAQEETLAQACLDNNTITPDNFCGCEGF